MPSTINFIGNTPLVKIDRLNNNQKTAIFAKLEGFNPSGSVKDRIVLAMIEKAEKEGLLTKDKTIIEPTSGNTGISLAMLGAMKGYKVKIILPESMLLSKRKMIKMFGAEIILVKEEEWRDAAIKFAKNLVKESNNSLFLLNQFENGINVKTHYETTGQEILEQISQHQQDTIDYFVAGIGTGGTIVGVTKRLKEKYPNIKVIGVQPRLGSKVEGLKSIKEGYVPPILDLKIIDKIVEVEEKDALFWQKELAEKEGIFTGISSGAAMFVAQKLSQEIPQGNIVTIFPDRGDKYL